MPFQNKETVELLWQIVHQRQAANLQASMLKNDLNECRLEDFEESITLHSFLQRAVNKPLIVSAGGFAELTRSFLVTVGLEAWYFKFCTL